MNAAAANNEALAAFNGSVLILAAYCGVFLAIHLLATDAHQHLSWRQRFLRLPTGMQLAVAVAALSLGEFISRLAVWIWRYIWHGDPDALAYFDPLLGFGAVILCLGFLCVLRVISRPFGRWPVAAAVSTVLAYLATFL